MKPITITSLFVAGLLFLSTQLFGQLTTTFSPASATPTVGSTVNLDIQVTNFTNIISVQFPVTYNSSVLQFVSASNFGLPGFGAQNYNNVAGKVTVSWFADLGSNPNGITLASGATMMRLTFQVLSTGNATVNLANTAPGIEFINSAGNPVTANYANGGATITVGNSGGSGGGSGGSGGSGGTLTGFHIVANGDSVAPGQKYCMPVTVNDFNNVVSMQYALHWDKTILRFDSTRAYNLAFLNSSNFGGVTANGVSLMSWYDQNAVGITKPNGTSIYEVCFTALGASGTQSLVTINGTGFPPGAGSAEAYNAAGMNIWSASVPVNDTIFVATPSGPPPFDSTLVTLIAVSDTVPPGSDVCIDIKVKKFTSVLSAQYVIFYDPAHIQYQSIQFGSNPLGLVLGANFNPATPGQIRFTWNDPGATGKTLPDGTVIYQLCFHVLGAAGTQSAISFGGITGFPVEIVKEPAGPVTPNLITGHVVVSDVVPLACTTTSTNISCFGGNNGAVLCTPSGGAGTGAFAYSWSGPSGYTNNIQNISNLSVAGTYTVTVTKGSETCTSSKTITAPSAALAYQNTTTNVNCNGGADGVVNLTTSGGTANYTYSWSGPNGFTAATEDISNLAAGTYTVTITDANGCTKVSAPAFSVTQPSAALAVTLVGTTNVKCLGQANGSATISIAGGTSPYTSFVWKNASNQTVSNVQNPTNLLAGSFNPTVSDSHGCTATLLSAAVVNGPSSALTSTATPTNVICNGASTGFISLNNGGGWGGYTVAWSGPNGYTATGTSVANLVAGPYAAVVTDQGGCTTTVPVTLTEPAPITYSLQTINDVSCASAGDGSIAITPAGGNSSSYTVTWNNNAMTGASIANLAGGAYTPTVRDAAGCTKTFSAIALDEPDPLTVSETVVNQNGANANGEIDITIAGGTTPYTFVWNDGPISEDRVNLTSGTYTVTVTDAHNCEVVHSMQVEQDNPLNGSYVLSTTNACDCNGTIKIVVSQAAQAPFVFTWGSNTFIAAEDTVVIENLCPALYNITLTDFLGNTFELNNNNITGLAPATVSSQTANPDCINANGAIVLSPVPSTTLMGYNWSTGSGASALINIPNGTYTVTVTNATSLCTATYTYTLSCPAPNAAGAVQSATCLSSSNGAIDLSFSGADGPVYAYSWTGPNGFTATTQDINNLVPGVYSVTVTDESNDEFTYNYTVGSVSTLTITNVNELSDHNGYQVSGGGVCDGEASVVFNGNAGAVSYLWSNGATTATTSTLCGGVYTVTVTDAQGCASVWSDSLTVTPTVIAQSSTVSNYNGYNVSCHGACDGTARLTVSGGIPPYTIQWPTGQVEELDQNGAFSQANNLCGGNYLVTITDDNGTESTQMVSLSEPDELQVLFAENPPTSFSRCDGELLVTTPGAVGAVELVWTASITGQSGTGPLVTSLCSGERVQFVVRDANGCLAIQTDTVPFPEDGCFRVRPVLTPGLQDGKNDFMFITCIESVPNSIEVYNRWGQLVFGTTAYNNSSNYWDGRTTSGQPLSEGVYYYILNYTDGLGDHQVKGYVNLLR